MKTGKIYRRNGCNGSSCTPLYRILQREHKKMGCRNNTCRNTDSSGSLDTALVDILVSLSGSFESKCWRRRKSPKHSLQRHNDFHLCIHIHIIYIMYIYIYLCACVCVRFSLFFINSSYSKSSEDSESSLFSGSVVPNFSIILIKKSNFPDFKLLKKMEP